MITSPALFTIVALSIGLLFLPGSAFARHSESAKFDSAIHETEEGKPRTDENTDGLPAENSVSREPCSIKFQSSYSLQFRGAYSRGYSADHHTTHSETLPFTIRHTGSECRYRISIRPVNGKDELSSGNANLKYRLSLHSKINHQQSGSISWKGSFAKGYAEHYDDLVLTIPDRQHVTAGIYSSRLSIMVYKLEHHQEVLESTQFISLSTQVTPFIKASFENGKTKANFDLDNLDSRKEFSLRMNIDANTRYSVYVSSENKGNLNHLLSNTLVPYGFFIGDKQVSLSSASSKVLSGRQSVTSETVPIRINYTPENKTLLAGKYEDRIEIRIVAD